MLPITTENHKIVKTTMINNYNKSNYQVQPRCQVPWYTHMEFMTGKQMGSQTHTQGGEEQPVLLQHVANCEETRTQEGRPSTSPCTCAMNKISARRDTWFYDNTRSSGTSRNPIPSMWCSWRSPHPVPFFRVLTFPLRHFFWMFWAIFLTFKNF